MTKNLRFKSSKKLNSLFKINWQRKIIVENSHNLLIDFVVYPLQMNFFGKILFGERKFLLYGVFALNIHLIADISSELNL